MKDFHGIIFAYNTFPELRELVKSRTAASLPFCGRYRLIGRTPSLSVWIPASGRSRNG